MQAVRLSGSYQGAMIRSLLGAFSFRYVEDLIGASFMLYCQSTITESFASELSNKFASRCNYIEFMNYNDFWLGVQHIIQLESDDPHIVPEFLNIRNRYDVNGNLEPWIDVEIIT